MHSVKFMVAILDRSLCETYIEICKGLHIPITLTVRCHGTAQRVMLDYLGLERTEKRLLFSIVPSLLSRQLMREIVRKLKIDRPGSGVAALLPIQSVAGNRMMAYLSEENLPINVSEEHQMQEAPYELIVAIANNGYTEMVMDAARSAKATGGTVVHAKGTGMERAEKFFGVSLAEEKEMVFIIARRQDKANIMRAIIKNAGMRSEAGSIVFSLPVSHVEGLHLPDDDDESIDQ